VLVPVTTITGSFTEDLSQGATLLVSWTPGRSYPSENFSVTLDGITMTSRTAAGGVCSSDPSGGVCGWVPPYYSGSPGLPYYTEIFDFGVLGSGIHTLTISYPRGDGIGFDYLKLSTPEREYPILESTLKAGQNIDAGTLTVTNDGTNLYVEYQTIDGWEMTETHLAVECSLEEIPQTQPNKKGKGGGNPIPGHFEYSAEHDPAVTKHTEIISLSELGCGNKLFIAAHAVVQLEESCPAIMYGTSLGGSGVGDKIYEIDVSAETASLLFNTGLSPSSVNGPNGNAYDSINNRLYYSTYASSDYLYFYDFTNPVNNSAGSLPGGQVACAGWYNGNYYYIPQRTGKLYETTFNLDGTVNASAMVYEYSGKSFNFGDVVITSNGLMYGSSAVNGVGKFWSINLSDYTYTEISNMAHMQLAFGSDGVLYGHDAGNANFYIIDPLLGTRTLISQINSLKFTDLASGPYEPCVPQVETAWGDEVGIPFPGSNWAMYLIYEMGEPVLVETIDVYANDSNPTYSTISLESGVEYELEAVGTAFAGGKYTTDIEFDAKYSITHSKAGDTWTDAVTDYELYGPTLLDLFVDGGSVDWGAYNPVHTYYWTLTGAGLPLELLIYDIYYPNNTGFITVNIYELP